MAPRSTQRAAAAPPTAEAALEEAAALCAEALERALPGESRWPSRLHAAMRYSVFAGGKRLRPALALASARACGGSADAALDAMAAIELLHTYTLIHDDLPAMDDDDLRRGRPTCHKAFDEATAILAGDALQAEAFACAARISLAAVRALAAAAGSLGVVGGQMEDLAAEGAPLGDGSGTRLEAIHRAKTAAIIACACALGAHSAGASAPELAALQAYGAAAGLAFQIADDVLDASATSAVLGKTAGKDAAQGKLTYVAVYGLERARAEARARTAEAVACLAPFGERGQALAALARLMGERER